MLSFCEVASHFCTNLLALLLRFEWEEFEVAILGSATCVENLSQVLKELRNDNLKKRKIVL